MFPAPAARAAPAVVLINRRLEITPNLFLFKPFVSIAISFPPFAEWGPPGSHSKEDLRRVLGQLRSPFLQLTVRRKRLVLCVMDPPRRVNQVEPEPIPCAGHIREGR